MDVRESGYMPTARDRCSCAGQSTVEARAAARHVGRASASLVVHARVLAASEEQYLGKEVGARKREGDGGGGEISLICSSLPLA